MHNTLQALLAAHNNLRRLVALLERQPVMLADPDDSHASLLVDALSYLTQYPDTWRARDARCWMDWKEPCAKTLLPANG